MLDMDDYIAYVAACERERAQTTLQWDLDRLRLYAGLVEVVPVEDPPIYRTLRHKRDVEGRAVKQPLWVPDPPLRFLPTAPGWGVFIRDVA